MSSIPAVPHPVAQGYAQPSTERLPMPALDSLSTEQRAAADALIAGPRKGVFGPFIALLRSPQLMDRVGKLGEYLRFGSTLEARVRELVTCAVARHVGNQFEWLLHADLALKAGVSAQAIESLRLGRRVAPLQDDEQVALDFTLELLRNNGVGDASYEAAKACFGEPGTVELTTMVGYFVMVCWVINVAHTPGKAGDVAPLPAFPL
jgi:4-carboxymuconolactone decarboxylase